MIANTRKLIAIFICIGFIYGCSAVLIGAGAGVGVFTWKNGVLTRSYPVAFAQARQATETVLTDLGIRITQEQFDGINLKIQAQRKKGQAVTLRIEMVASQITSIAVRTGYIGLWNRNYSEHIHASIAQKIS
jgi:Protein of unknown function (DUF3568)